MHLYKVYLSDVVVGSDWLAMRARTGGASGSTVTNSEYRYESKMFWRSSSTAGDTGEHAWGDAFFRIGWTNSESVKPLILDLVSVQVQ